MVTAASAVEWKTIRAQDRASDQWLHSGIAVLDGGRIVYGSVGGQGIVFHDTVTDAATEIPLSVAHPHGITATGAGADARLWIADPGPRAGTGQVLELSTSGEVLSRTRVPLAVADKPGSWRPTAVAVVTDGADRGTLWVADGYGQHRVHRIRPDGSESVWDEADGVPFDCPHGITLDRRSGDGTVVIADRGNRRLVFLKADGSLDRIVTHELMTSPSCLAIRGPLLVVTDLYGAVLTVDDRDRVEVVAGEADATRPGWPNLEAGDRTVAPALHDGELNSPHGVDVAENGDIYLTEWVFGGRVVRLRLPGDDAKHESEGDRA
jgi:hypothetical protein